MKINVTKLLDNELYITRLTYSPPDKRDTADSPYYGNRPEGTSANQSYSFMIEDNED